LVEQLGVLCVPAGVHLQVKEGKEGVAFDEGEEDSKGVLHIPTDIAVVQT